MKPESKEQAILMIAREVALVVEHSARANGLLPLDALASLWVTMGLLNGQYASQKAKSPEHAFQTVVFAGKQLFVAGYNIGKEV